MRWIGCCLAMVFQCLNCCGYDSVHRPSMQSKRPVLFYCSVWFWALQNACTIKTRRSRTWNYLHRRVETILQYPFCCNRGLKKKICTHTPRTAQILSRVIGRALLSTKKNGFKKKTSTEITYIQTLISCHWTSLPPYRWNIRASLRRVSYTLWKSLFCCCDEYNNGRNRRRIEASSKPSEIQ